MKKDKGDFMERLPEDFQLDIKTRLEVKKDSNLKNSYLKEITEQKNSLKELKIFKMKKIKEI